ncbi:unnamed protein product [Owenia fusiformis]|uniref:Uncharacterized protein n=1 Tax=Owenia fusiformis TaxID=6347 RepID=A0A8S4NSP8_OWEFU|nr:unnamed protein product [Owenia fusiformis]
MLIGGNYASLCSIGLFLVIYSSSSYALNLQHAPPKRLFCPWWGCTAKADGEKRSAIQNSNNILDTLAALGTQDNVVTARDFDPGFFAEETVATEGISPNDLSTVESLARKLSKNKNILQHITFWEDAVSQLRNDLSRRQFSNQLQNIQNALSTRKRRSLPVVKNTKVVNGEE